MKRIQRKIFGILILLLFLSNTSFASHLLGGEIVWECLPNGKYRFTLTIYRDCTGIPQSSTSESLTNNAGVSITCTKIATNYINKECNAPTCAGATTPYIGAIEQHVYRSGQITFPNIAPPAAGWWFQWYNCCRPGTVTNLQSPSGQGYVLRAFMFPYTPPGATSPLSANPCYDNSPDFLENPDVTVCSGFEATYLNLGSDKDLDSTYYEWVQPLSSGITGPGSWQNVTWKSNSTYSYNTPLPGTSQNSNNVPANLNSEIGMLTFKSFTIGSFATCIRITEYRCGQKIGEVYRDIPIFIKTCTPPTGVCGGTANNAPTLSFGYYPGFDTLTPVYNAGILSHYEMTVYAKTQIKFKITSQDVDLQPSCTPQQISFKGKGGNLSPAPNYNNTNNCLFQTPCATVTSLNSNGGFTSSLNNDVEFNWQTTCDHLTYQPYACGSFKNTYEFFFRFEDNACPIPATSYATVKINVLNYPPVPPDLSESCISIEPNNDIKFDFIPPADTGIQFDYYVVFRSNAGGPFAGIDTIYNYLTYEYTDVNAPAGINQYFMRTAGGCSLISDPSDTIQSIVLDVVPTPPPPNSSIANLSWNAKNPSGPYGEYYQIWRELCGTNNWELVDSTQTLAFSDTVNVCGNCLRYQIRIGNACLSTTDSGFFADQSNTDIIVIDSVSVNGGLATMAWDTSNTSSDVLNYIILKKDANGFWIPVDTVPIGSPFPYVYSGSMANSESESFKVVTLDSCGNQSSDLNATAHRTIYMSVNSDPCDAFVRIRWNTYKQWTQTAVGKYELLADIYDPNTGTTQNGVLVYQGTPTDSTYQHNNIQSGFQYCYYLKVTDTTGLYTSTSNLKCIDGLVVKKSRLLYLARATVKGDESIEIFAYFDNEADVIDYGIERADDIKGPYLVLGRIPKPTSGPAEIKYNDYSANVYGQSYYYRISSQDSCGAVDTISNIGRNILLKVTANGNLTNTLTWNPYEQWGGTVGKYEVYRQVDYNGAWTLVTDQLGPNDTVFIDNIRPFSESKGAFCYYVKAYEANNPLGFLDEFGMPFRSQSNDACITHEARLFVPSAFNPMSAIPENTVWKPSNVFAREDSYEMFIMNRWGDKIFQTTNPDEGWDGNYKGEPQPVGVYTYYINYRSLEGYPIEERGTFTLYRNGDSQ